MPPYGFENLPPIILHAIIQWQQGQLADARPQVAWHFENDLRRLLVKRERGGMTDADTAEAILAIQPSRKRRKPEAKVPGALLDDVRRSLQEELSARWTREGRRSVYGPRREARAVDERALTAPELDALDTYTYIVKWHERRAAGDVPFTLDRQGRKRRLPKKELAALVAKGEPPQRLTFFLVAKLYGVSKERVRKARAPK